MRGVTAPLKAVWVFISLANIASFLNSYEGRKKGDHLKRGEGESCGCPCPVQPAQGMAHLRDMQNQVEKFSFQ